MARQALTVGFRLTFKYTVSSFQHKASFYLECVASGDASGFDAVARPPFTNQGVSTLDANFFPKLAPFYDSATASFDSMLLEHRVGTDWVFTYAKAYTGAAPSGGGYDPAMGITLSGKDVLNRSLPFFLYEGSFGATAKYPTYSALGTTAKALAGAIYNAGGVAAQGDPYMYRLSRDGQFVGRWIAWVTDSNEKLRRLRRIK